MASLARRAVTDAEGFYDNKCPEPGTAADVVVISLDGAEAMPRLRAVRANGHGHTGATRRRLCLRPEQFVPWA